MSVKFFGQFLLEKGKIIREELLDALKFQKEVNVKLGTIALDSGYLTVEQIEQITRLQQQSDKMFGEIAVAHNYLTEKQLEELLLIQKNERISLGEALVQKGYLTLAELALELKDYKQSQHGVTERIYAEIKKTPDSLLAEVFLDMTIKLFRRIADIEMQVLNIHNNADRISPHLWNFYQNFSGKSAGVFILSVPDPILLSIASHMAQEKIWEIDNFAKDGVKEFVNYIVGNSVAKLSQENLPLELQPPKIVTSLGKIEIPSESNQVMSAKLGSQEYEIKDYTLQVSLIYSPVA